MPSLQSTAAALLVLLTFSAAQSTYPQDIVGTWSSKSNQTLTGPGFYDPVKDVITEPSRTGISYSFTSDGYYEEAYYRAISNPAVPSCPSAIMQWQHGSWQLLANGSLVLTPIAVDGRQVLSEPCKYKNSIYTRYNQSELMKSYSAYLDKYHGIQRLDLFRFDGSPLPPMYLAFQPPMMLPTTTLNPTSTAAATAGATTAAKAKRGLEPEIPLSWKPFLENDETRDIVHRIDADRLWWIGVSLTGVGGLLYFGPRRLGIQL